MAWFRWQGSDLIIQVQIQPRASRSEFAGITNDLLRVRITAPPIDNKANLHLIEFLATQFGIAKSRVQLLRGRKTRNKLLRVRAPVRLPAELGIERR